MSPEIVEQCSSNLAPEMYNRKETERYLLCCCVTLWALVSFCEKPNSPICNPSRNLWEARWPHG